jgi:protein-serine/threonine kinase
MFKEQSIINKNNSDDNINVRINNIIQDDLDFPSNNVDIESFKILELLGKGSFGEVYLVELLTNNKKYAMKVLNKNKILSQNIVRYVVTERNVLSNIKHPFIVRLFYAFQTNEFLYLILEYCEGRDICYHLRKNKYFEEETVKIICAQLVLAVEELHKHNIIYR